jgi:uncharacterized protein (DUF1501 family)
MQGRRKFLQQLALGAAASSLPAISFAKADTDARLVLVILRGAVDGLALAAPYGDGNYSNVRGAIAIPAPGDGNGLLKLDGLFGLNPALRHTHRLFQQDQALIVHAVASPYRERSHFDGQDVLENGATKAGLRRDGWLNRALQPLGSSLGNESAIALSQNTPLVLRGDNSVTSWAPSQMQDVDDDVLRRLESLYTNDEFFATRLAQALDSQDIAGDMPGLNGRRRGNGAAQLKVAMQSAAKFLTAANGPQIAVLEAGGWDTHANQGANTGALANKLGDLDDALAELHKGMGDHWPDTVIAVVTEFGRTVNVNGTRGTDHGTGAAAILMGGAINGGRIIADWPGLGRNDLYQGRDLYPTTDLRSVFKGILAEHLLIADGYLDSAVFPDSGHVKPLEGLIRA